MAKKKETPEKGSAVVSLSQEHANANNAGTQEPSAQERLAYFSKIPVYGKTTAQNQKKMDGIIDAFDMTDPEVAREFGSEVLAADSDFNQKVRKELEKMNFSLIDDPMKEIAEFMSSEHIENLRNRVNVVLKNGGEVAKRNVLSLMFGAAVAAAAGPVAGLGAAGVGTAMKEWARSKREPDSEETLLKTLQEALLNYDTHLGKVKDGAGQMPNVDYIIHEAGNNNIRSLIDLSLYLGAGAEIMRRYKQDVLPKALADTDNPEHYFKVETASQNLARQIAILSVAHTGAISNTNVLGSMSQTVADSVSTAESLINHESHAFARDLVTGHLALQVLGFNKNIKDFRTNTRNIAATTIASAEAAAKLAEGNRVDSKENLQAMLALLEKSYQLVQNAEARRITNQKERQSLVLQLEDKSQSIMMQQMNQKNFVIHDAEVLLEAKRGEEAKQTMKAAMEIEPEATAETPKKSSSYFTFGHK